MKSFIILAIVATLFALTFQCTWINLVHGSSAETPRDAQLKAELAALGM